MIRAFKAISVEVDEKADKFYAVARGKVVGIFTDYNEVKNHVREILHFLYHLIRMKNPSHTFYFFSRNFKSLPQFIYN